MLIDKLKKTVKKHSLLESGDTVLIGVSGGPDSLALLYLLNDLKKEFRLKLHIAHLDHMLRRSSAADRKFVENIARGLSIPVTSKNINVKKISQAGSIEENCRNARLDFLFSTAAKIKADKIALGHNLDDQAETVLMRLLRGSGLSGLSGISPRRCFRGFTVIRPLLAIKRKEINSYLKRRKIRPRIDLTNLQDIYLRNRIRNTLIPLLEKNYNRNIKEVLSNTAENVAEDYDFLNRFCLDVSGRLGPRIDLKKFSCLHISVRRMVLRNRIIDLKGDTRRITFIHVKELEDLIANRPAGSVVDLPGNIRVKKNQKTLVFSKNG